MKYLFFVLVIFFGCTPHVENTKVLRYNFLETQLENSKASLKLKMQNDERKIGPIYQYVIKIDNKFEMIINAIQNEESSEMIKEGLMELKKDIQTGWAGDSLLVLNSKRAINELLHQPHYSNSDEIIAQINYINLACLTSMHESIDKYDFVYDYLQVFVKNQTGKEGVLFETALLPVCLSSTQIEIVRIGTGVDSLNHLIGKIDTLKRNESHFSVYQVENPRKGIYDIPAEITVAGAGGKRSKPIRFTIQYEIK